MNQRHTCVDFGPSLPIKVLDMSTHRWKSQFTDRGDLYWCWILANFSGHGMTRGGIRWDGFGAVSDGFNDFGYCRAEIPLHY
jgi:hypothetical protein